MKIKLFIGIDVGVNGAVSSVNVETGKVEVVNIPPKVEDISDYMMQLKQQTDQMLACIEKITYFRSDSETIGKIYRTEKLMRAYNEFTTIMRLLQVPHIRVMPHEWQTYMNLRRRDAETYYQRKKRFVEAARSFAIADFKDNQADAVLLMKFIYKKYNYDPEWIMKRLPATVAKQIDE